MELRCTHDRGRGRPGQHRTLVRLLGGAVAGGEAVGADDRDDDDPPHARLGAVLLQFRVAAVKKSVAACCSGEAPLVASTRDWTSRNASARPSAVTTSTPAEREIATTPCLCSSSTSTRWRWPRNHNRSARRSQRPALPSPRIYERGRTLPASLTR
jgi:hypothetical protein